VSGPTKDDPRGQAGEVGTAEQERQPKDITFDPLWAWYRLGANARLKPAQKHRKRRKGVRK
jgi:hypothetical protein